MKTVNLKRNEKVTIDSLSFWGVFGSFNKRNLFLNASFPFSLLVGTFVWWMLKWLPDDRIKVVAEYLGNTGAQIAGTILGIVIAGLAVLTALANGKLMNLLLKKRLLQRLLFPFWIIAALWGIVIAACMILFLAYPIFGLEAIKWYVIVLSFLFSFSVCSTIALVGNTIQISIIAAEYEQ